MSEPALSLVVLRVDDVRASEAFYRALGLDLVTEQHGRGPTHLAVQLGTTVVELYPRRSGPGTEGLRLGLTVPDLDAMCARLADAVVSDGARDGERVVVVRDPDGHKVELTQCDG